MVNEKLKQVLTISMHRYEQLLKNLGITAYKLEKQARLGNGVVGKAIFRNTEISLESIEKIILAFPQVNEQWLRTGEGEPLSHKRLPDEPKELNFLTHEQLTAIIAGAIQAVIEDNDTSFESDKLIAELKKNIIKYIDIEKSKYNETPIYSTEAIKEIFEYSLKLVLQEVLKKQ